MKGINKETIVKRSISFDALKLFAIYLVIWGHCILWLGDNNCDYNPLYRGIYSFHTPLFMMISGYFSYSSMKLPFKELLKKKTKDLLYPCFLWGMLLWIVYESIYSFRYGHNYISIGALISDYYWLSDFWFLKSCFICYILVFLGSNSKLKKRYWVIATIAISQIIAVNFVSFMFPCFLIGWELRQNKSFSKLIISNHVFLCLLFGIALVFWDSDMWQNSHGIPANIFDKNLSTWIIIILSRLYRLLIGILGSLAAISLFHNFKYNTNSSITISAITSGRYTLEIYIIQSILIEKILCNYIKLQMSQFYYNLIVTPIIAITILALCIFIAQGTHKNKYVALFLWGRS